VAEENIPQSFTKVNKIKLFTEYDHEANQSTALHRENKKWKDKATHKQTLTRAASGATPRPTSLLTANALATHDVIVSGAVTCIVTRPSALSTRTQLTDQHCPPLYCNCHVIILQ